MNQTNDLVSTEMLTLRKRIHFLERHNQIFERCESAWCHPNSNNDPAKEGIGMYLDMDWIVSTLQKDYPTFGSGETLSIAGLRDAVGAVLRIVRENKQRDSIRTALMQALNECNSNSDWEDREIKVRRILEVTLKLI